MFPKTVLLKQILLFGAGKSATGLIEYLLLESVNNNWELVVADGNLLLAEEKIGQAPNARAIQIDVKNVAQRNELIRNADLVISMLPAALHFLVAKDCVEFGKNLLTASYVDDQIRSLAGEIKRKGLLFLCEMGLDPGIDHMSAMRIIHRIRSQSGIIHSFFSHCGGLVAPESDDNPWHYKISWNPRNVVLAGKSGASFKARGQVQHLPYETLFDPYRLVEVEDQGYFAWYPNRDSLEYMSLYHLEEADSFVRTTLRHPDFCLGWRNLIQLKLTDETIQYDTDGMSLKKFFRLHFERYGFGKWLEDTLHARSTMAKDLMEQTMQLLKAEKNAKDDAVGAGENSDPNMLLVNEGGELKNINLDALKNDTTAIAMQKLHEANLSVKLLFYLGLDSEEMINKGRCSAADVLQFSLEKNLALKPGDKDMIVMLHQFEYSVNGVRSNINSRLVVKGRDHIHTAMAKTVGLPLGIAAKLILQGRLNIVGLHIPVLPEIYEPVLKELEEYGIIFYENQN